MRWMVPCALVVVSGCFGDLMEPAAGEPEGVYGVRTVGQERDFERLAKEAANWDGKLEGDVIGQRSGFDAKPRRSRVYAERDEAEPVVRGSDPEIEREVHVLSARVDRLEQMVAGGPRQGPGAPAAAPAKPALSIYQVSPDGRTSWVSAGSGSGVNVGQLYQVRRGATVIGQARVARVWPDVSELTILWSNGAAQRGDTIVESNEPPASN